MCWYIPVNPDIDTRTLQEPYQLSIPFNCFLELVIPFNSYYDRFKCFVIDNSAANWLEQGMVLLDPPDSD